MIIVLSFIAGVIGTGLGGVVAAFLGKRSDQLSCLFLSFAGGIMTAIVCFGLVPEALKISGMFNTVLGLVLGIIVILFLDEMIDRITKKQGETLALHNSMEEFFHTEEVIRRNSLRRSGIIMLFAIGIHNIPEGLAMGAGGQYNLELGILISIMIALHDVPEGMAIAVPLIAGGMKPSKVIFLTALSGLPTVLGAIIGHIVGTISPTIVALSLAGAGGAMLYVVFGEMLPQAISMRKDRVPTLVLLLGMVFGLLIAFVQ